MAARLNKNPGWKLDSVGDEFLFPLRYKHHTKIDGLTELDRILMMCPVLVSMCPVFRFVGYGFAIRTACTHTMGPEYTQTHKAAAIKITLSPPSLCALMPAPYSLSINKIRPCAVRALRGIWKQPAIHRRIWYKQREPSHSAEKHRARLKSRHVQQRKINEIASVGPKNQTMIWDRGA